MEQKPRYHVEVYSQTASSPLELKRSPSEVCLGEALEYLLEKPMIGQEAADTQGHRDEKFGELRARDRSFADTDVFFGDVCAGDHSFAFQNRVSHTLSLYGTFGHRGPVPRHPMQFDMLYYVFGWF